MSHLPRTEAGRAQPAEEAAGFTSKLSTPRERFLAAVVEHALLIGRRSAKDFIRTFSPREVMSALADQPRLRAKILVATIGIHERVALKKPAVSAGEDLEIAIAEGVTTEDDVVSLFDPDDRVRYLDNTRLWAFVTEGDFWRVGADPAQAPIAREHIAYIIERGRAEKLINDRDIIDSVGLPVLVDALPKELLGRVIERSLTEARAGRVFKDERVLEILTPFVLAEHVSLAHLWVKVVEAKLSFWRSPSAPSKPAAPISSPSMPVAPPESSAVVAKKGSSPSLPAAAASSSAPPRARESSPSLPAAPASSSPTAPPASDPAPQTASEEEKAAKADEPKDARRDSLLPQDEVDDLLSKVGQVASSLAAEAEAEPPKS